MGRVGSMPAISPIKGVWGDMMEDEGKVRKKRGSPLAAYFRQTLSGKGRGEGKGGGGGGGGGGGLGNQSDTFFDVLSGDLALYCHFVCESLCRR